MAEGVPNGWRCTRPERRYVRTDGAVVKYDDSSPYPNPIKPSARMWTAWEPDPGQSYLKMSRRNSRGFTWPRRYRTPEAAMRAADKAWPVKNGAHADPVAPI